MFEGLSEKLSSILDGLTRRGALSEEDVNNALREVRRALLEADVALEVVRSFVDKVRTRAVGAEVVKSVTPGQMVVKIVHDQLVEMLGSDAETIDLNAVPPVPVLMVGLQGSGKTTTTAKIAKRLTDRSGRRVLMASLDTRRPAAMEQLAILGKQVGVETLPIVAGQSAVQIARRAMEAARLGGFDVVMLDTAGRVTVDEALMTEAADVKAATDAHEVLLVADALTGQDAVNTARAFKEALPLTGIVLTKMDGDARGGAALSVRQITGAPIKFAGVSEKIDGLEVFDADRHAGRVLGMGDIVALVEEVHKNIDLAATQKLADKVKSGTAFDLEDFLAQISQMKKMGGLAGLMEKLPTEMTAKAGAADMDRAERDVRRMEGIICSMTPEERRKPDLIKASRKRRIAAGAGVQVQEVNRLLNQFGQMRDMMKKMKGGGLMKLMKRMGGMKGLPGMR